MPKINAIGVHDADFSQPIDDATCKAIASLNGRLKSLSLSDEWHERATAMHVSMIPAIAEIESLTWLELGDIAKEGTDERKQGFRIAILSFALGATGQNLAAQVEYPRLPVGFVYDGVEITPETARDLSRKHSVLTLQKIKTVSEDVAKNLVTPYHDTFLTLPSVETLDPAAARALSDRVGYLDLHGLRALSPETAAALVSEPGQTIYLSGVDEISPEVARMLAKGRRWGLRLGLKELPPAMARILATGKSSLTFPKLKTLSVESAEALAAHRRALGLGAATITKDVATALLKHEGNIGIELASRLEPGVGDILARHSYEVHLMLEEIDSAALARKLFSEPYASTSVYRLRTISAEVAAVYAELDPGYLAKLDTLSPQAANALASGNYDLDLPALASLTPDLATALTARNRSVYLRGIKTLDGPDAVAVAEALASTPAPVYVPNLERISAPALVALRKKATITIPPDEKLTIVP